MAKYLIGTDLADCDFDGLVKELIALLGYAAGSWDLIDDPSVSVEFIKIDHELDDSEVEALILAHGTMAQCVVRRCEERCKEVDILREIKYKTTMSHGGTTWQVDRSSQAGIQFRESYAMAVLLDPLVDPPPDVPWTGGYLTWRDADNNDVTFATAQNFISFAKAVSDHCNVIFAQATAHKDALRGMVDPTIADINNYDITGGW
jgi:hypothetical protein